ncbi:MAG: hypothetical protein CBHOC_0218 [uncultured Caballeronia sp.]|nr:MAG: hypothetical protein CBHOC_0218 [uncultured Caballeronia sp.]
MNASSQNPKQETGDAGKQSGQDDEGTSVRQAEVRKDDLSEVKPGGDKQ